MPEVNTEEVKAYWKDKLKRAVKYVQTNYEPIAAGMGIGAVILTAAVVRDQRKFNKHSYAMRLPKKDFVRIAGGKVDNLIPSYIYEAGGTTLVLLNETDFVNAVKEGKELFPVPA